MTVGIPETYVNDWYYGVTKDLKEDIQAKVRGAKRAPEEKKPKKRTSTKKPTTKKPKEGEEAGGKDWRAHYQALRDVKNMTPEQKRQASEASQKYRKEADKKRDEENKPTPKADKDTQYIPMSIADREDNIPKRKVGEYGESRVDEKHLKSRREKLREAKRSERRSRRDVESQAKRQEDKENRGKWRSDDNKKPNPSRGNYDADKHGKGEDYRSLDLKTQKEWAKRNQQFNKKPQAKRQYKKLDELLSKNPKVRQGDEHPTTMAEAGERGGIKEQVRGTEGKYEDEKDIYTGEKIKSLKRGLSLMNLVSLNKSPIVSDKLTTDPRYKKIQQEGSEQRKRKEEEEKIKEPTFYEQARDTNFGTKPISEYKKPKIGGRNDRKSDRYQHTEGGGFYTLRRGGGKRSETVKPKELDRTHGDYKIGDKTITSTREAQQHRHEVDNPTKRSKQRKGDDLKTHEYHKPAAVSSRKKTPQASHYNPNRKEGAPPEAKQEAHEEEARRKEIRANIKQRKEIEPKTRNQIDTRRQIDGKDNPNYLKKVPVQDGTRYSGASVRERQDMEDEKAFQGDKLTESEEKLVKPKEGTSTSQRKHIQGEGAKKLHEEMSGQGKQHHERAPKKESMSEEESLAQWKKQQGKEGKAEDIPSWLKGGARKKWKNASPDEKVKMKLAHQRSEAQKKRKNKAIIELQGLRLKAINTQQRMSADSPSPKKPTGNNQGFSGGVKFPRDEDKPSRGRVPTPRGERHREAFERARKTPDEISTGRPKRNPRSRTTGQHSSRYEQRNQRDLDREFMRRESDRFEGGRKDREGKRRDRFGTNP